MNKKIENKICILNELISDKIENKISNGILDFENDITIDNNFLEIRFEDAVAVSILTNNVPKSLVGKYLGQDKKNFTIVQTSFFLIEDNKKPYLITRSSEHSVTLGLSILFPISVQIDSVVDTVGKSIANIIDKLIYFDENKSYFGFRNIFKKNHLKYFISSYGVGYNSVSDDKANYIFFVYSVEVKNEDLSSSNRKYFLFHKNDKNKDIHDSFELAPNDFYDKFEEWHESLDYDNKIKCKYCFEGFFDISLLIAIIQNKSNVEFKKAKFIKKEHKNVITEHISKYGSTWHRITLTLSRHIKERVMKAVLKFPEKIIYGFLLSAVVLFVDKLIDGFFLKIFIFLIGAIILAPISEKIIDFLIKIIIFIEEPKSDN